MKFVREEAAGSWMMRGGVLAEGLGKTYLSTHVWPPLLACALQVAQLQLHRLCPVAGRMSVWLL